MRARQLVAPSGGRGRGHPRRLRRHQRQQRLRIDRGRDHRPRRAGDEAFVDRVCDERQQRVEVALDVEHADRLAVQARAAPTSGPRTARRTCPSRPAAPRSRRTRSAMVAFRSCIVSTMRRSSRPVWAISRATSASGMTPVTRPPPASTASATTPMRPIRAPPYTRLDPAPTSTRPNCSAAVRYSGRVPNFEPARTQMRFMRGRERRSVPCRDVSVMPHVTGHDEGRSPRRQRMAVRRAHCRRHAASSRCRSIRTWLRRRVANSSASSSMGARSCPAAAA